MHDHGSNGDDSPPSGRLRLWLVAVAFTCALATAAAFVGSGGCGASSATASPAILSVPQVRVQVLGRVRSVQLSATQAPVLEGRELAGAVRLNLPSEPVDVSLTSGGWRIGDRVFARGELTFTPADDGTLSVSGDRYRGRLRFVPVGEDHFDVVNDVDVESYLMGVLPKELLAQWSQQTYEAQAVVARTYALFELKTAGPGRGHFDLYDDDRSQVYGGMNAETHKSRNAVRATTGQVVVHDTPAGPRIFKAYFHSTSGGVTLGNHAAFNEAPIPALGTVQLGELGKSSSRFEWDAFAVPKSELTRRIRLWGERRGHPIAKMAGLDRIEIVERNAGGRPTRFEVIDVRQNHYSLIPEEMRWSVNTDRGDNPQLFSGWFRPINNQTNVVFADGRGWGHGVGMCQWSAEGMAKQGQNHLQIVTTSYPGTQVVRAY